MPAVGTMPTGALAVHAMPMHPLTVHALSMHALTVHALTMHTWSVLHVLGVHSVPARFRSLMHLCKGCGRRQNQRGHTHHK